MIAYFPRLEEYEHELSDIADRTEEEQCALLSLRVLLDHLRQNYGQTLSGISGLLANDSITFDLLYTILIPGTIFLQQCPTTHELQALRLRTTRKSSRSYHRCENTYRPYRIPHVSQ